MVPVHSSIFFVPGYYFYVKLLQSSKVPVMLTNYSWASDNLSLSAESAAVCLVGVRIFKVRLRLGRRANLCP